MATLNISIDPNVFQAAKLEAARRDSSLDLLVAEYLKQLAEAATCHATMPSFEGNEANEQLDALYALRDYAADHPFRIDLTSFTRADLYERR